VARETASGKKAIVPIWHDIDQKGVAQYSPTLADRLAGKSSDGTKILVRQIVAVLKDAFVVDVRRNDFDSQFFARKGRSNQGDACLLAAV
jgi:hypothetical protein